MAITSARKTTQAKLGLDPEIHDPLPSLSWGGGDECPDQPLSILETKWIRSGCEISFESKQDQLRVELWSSLLVGGIAASLIITRAMPGTSAGSV